MKHTDTAWLCVRVVTHSSELREPTDHQVANQALHSIYMTCTR